MIHISLDVAALASARLTIAPLREAVESLRLLADPRPPLHLVAWIRRSREAIRGCDISLLMRLAGPAARCLPNFLTSTANAYGDGLEQALAEVAATPAEQVRHDLDLMFQPHPLPAGAAVGVQRRGHPTPDVVIRALRDGPEAFARRAAADLSLYWHRAFGEDWPRIRHVLAQDVRYRAERLVSGGVAGLFTGLHPTVDWTGDTLTIDRSDSRTERARQLLLMPSVFIGPEIGYSCTAGQAVICYPARGIADVWNSARPTPDTALAQLIGATRAQLLADLYEGRTTLDLAHRHDLTPPAVSYHLGALYRAGLVDRTREGRRVLYQINGRGEVLFEP